MNFKTLGIVIAVAAVVGGLAYNAGTNQTATVTPMPASQQSAAATAAPAAANRPALPAAIQQPALPTGHGAYERFTHFNVGQRNVKSIFADGDIVWVGTSGGVIEYHTATGQHISHNVDSNALLSNGVFHVSKIGDKIAAGTYGGGLSLYDTNKKTWKNYNIPEGLGDQFVYDALTTKSGDVWVATWSGATLIRGGKMDDPDAWITYTVKNTNDGLANDWVYGLQEGQNGDVWLGTEGGLTLFRDGKWKSWNHDDGLGAKYDEVKDDIKFTNDPGDASKHHARQKVEQGLEDVDIAFNPNYIISMVIDDDGNVWNGTWGAGLSMFDGEKWTTYTQSDGLPANHIFMLHKDKFGDIWAGTSKGLAKFKGHGKGFDVKTKLDGLFSDNVFSMAEADDGSVWLGSFGGVTLFREFEY